MKFLVVDDEPLVCEETVTLLRNLGHTNISAYVDELSLLEDLEHLSFDCAILDIELPMINGLELAQRLLNHNPRLQVIFLTGYQEYAIHAFELNAIDYLLKPISKARLEKALSRLPDLQPQSSTRSKLSLNLFNQFELRNHDDVVRFKRHKTQELLAYLVLNDFKAHRDALCDALYDVVDYRKALIQLQTLIYQARKDLQDHREQLQIEFKNQIYYLKLSHVEVDALRFIQLELDAVTEELIRAVEHYDKGLLHAHDWPWLVHEQFNFEAKLNSLLAELQQRALRGESPSLKAWVELKLNQYLP